ncbi:MAG: hypothetical protein R2688_05965 [Fimbriimonadaceae bacterium]
MLDYDILRAFTVSFLPKNRSVWIDILTIVTIPMLFASSYMLKRRKWEQFQINIEKVSLPDIAALVHSENAEAWYLSISANRQQNQTETYAPTFGFAPIYTKKMRDSKNLLNSQKTTIMSFKRS